MNPPQCLYGVAYWKAMLQVATGRTTSGHILIAQPTNDLIRVHLWALNNELLLHTNNLSSSFICLRHFARLRRSPFTFANKFWWLQLTL